jgi:hypothetical protein
MSFEKPDRESWAEEIALYTMNEGALYETIRLPLSKNYAKRLANGTFKKELGIQGLDRLVKEGIKSYLIIFPGDPVPRDAGFRKMVAEELLEEMMPEIRDYAKDLKNR